MAVLRAPAGLERDDALDLDLRPAPAHPHLVGELQQRVHRSSGSRSTRPPGPGPGRCPAPAPGRGPCRGSPESPPCSTGPARPGVERAAELGRERLRELRPKVSHRRPSRPAARRREQLHARSRRRSARSQRAARSGSAGQLRRRAREFKDPGCSGRRSSAVWLSVPSPAWRPRRARRVQRGGDVGERAVAVEPDEQPARALHEHQVVIAGQIFARLRGIGGRERAPGPRRRGVVAARAGRGSGRAPGR